MTAKLTQALRKVGTPFRHRSASNPHRSDGHEEDSNLRYVKETHVNLCENGNEIQHQPRLRRKSLTLVSNIIHHRKPRSSYDASKPSPALPPELIDKVASFLKQHELTKFCRASRYCYIAAERYLYRRPFTRRFDKLLRTLEKHPYKADFILELALGFETDFYSVKYVIRFLI